MKIQWDDERDVWNREQHKISLGTAVLVFNDPHFIAAHDAEQDLGGDRCIAIGKVRDILLYVSFRGTEDGIWMLSARAGDEKERKIYMITTIELGPDREATEDQVRELEAVAGMNVLYDEDCPPLSPAMERSLRCAVFQRNRHRELWAIRDDP